MGKRAKTRVLVVGDEAAARQALQKLLELEGHRVETAGSEDAAPTAAALSADVVVTDLEKLGMDGIELLDRLRAQDAALPLIVVTSCGDVGSAVKATRAGAFSFLTKPVDSDALMVNIQRALELRALEAEAANLRRQLRDQDGTGEGTFVQAKDLPADLSPSAPSTGLRIPGSSMSDIERHAILSTLEACGGSTAKAADVLGISVRTIQYRLHDYGLAKKRDGDDG